MARMFCSFLVAALAWVAMTTAQSCSSPSPVWFQDVVVTNDHLDDGIDNDAEHAHHDCTLEYFREQGKNHVILAVTSEHHEVEACHVVEVDNGWDSVLNDQSNDEYSHVIEEIVKAFHDEKHHDDVNHPDQHEDHDHQDHDHQDHDQDQHQDHDHQDHDHQDHHQDQHQDRHQDQHPVHHEDHHHEEHHSDGSHGNVVEYTAPFAELVYRTEGTKFSTDCAGKTVKVVYYMPKI